MKNKNFNKKLVILTIISFVAFFMLLMPNAAAATMEDFEFDPSYAWINGGYFHTYIPDTPSGSGVFHAFLRIGGGACEKGYNTNGTLEFDTKGGQHTHAVKLNVIPTVLGDPILYPGLDGSTLYREFQFDMDQNQGGLSELLSLDTLEIYLTENEFLTGYPFNPSDSELVYDMDGAGDYFIKMNYSLNEGHGKRDLIVFIPDSDFDGLGYDNCPYGPGDCDTYVVLLEL